MIETAIEQLNFLIERIPSMLIQISDEKMSAKPEPDKWSRKEIIGHLIDSATNNHHRIVLGQFEDIHIVGYDQNKWIKFSYYQDIDCEQIISFWTIYNRQLLEIVKRIPMESLKRQIQKGDNSFTIEYLISDYVKHLEHHLKQVVDY